MYDSFYGFARSPFRLVADPSMLFVSAGAREGLSRLEYALRDGKGIVVMTGEVGTGKTTLVQRFLAQERPDLRTAYIFNPSLTGVQLLQSLNAELGLGRRKCSRLKLTRTLYEDLLRQRHAGRRTVLFIDEAQALPQETLEELRLLTNLETWQEKLLHIVLVGQPELLSTLESHGLRPLRQRVELFIEVEPLEAEETHRYIAHRLQQAQPTRRVRFSPAACARIHRIAQGVPRNVNKICDAALLVAFVDEATLVTDKHVREAVRTIDRWEVSLRLRGGRFQGPWRRLWIGAGAVAVLTAMLVKADTGTPPSAAPGQAAVLGHVLPAPLPELSGEIVLVHLGSFRERAAAESFAGQASVPSDRRLYLHTAVTQGERWHRVLLGDFTNPESAADFAAAALRSYSYAYAQPVRLTRRGLELWEAPR